MGAYIVVIVAIVCGAAVIIDKRHVNDQPENDDLKRRLDCLEVDIRTIKHQLKIKHER